MDSTMKIAASMFGGDPGLLNADLELEIKLAALLVQNAGGELRSRQAIAVIIINWQKRNPDRKAYFYGG